ncbi:unnamed protein product [Closterium sp. Naga37s-1]|nr:unnamed protein product [Closterium sp. Naga37s-1]
MAMAMSRWGLDKLLRSRSSDKLVSLLLPDGSMEMFGGGKTVADIMAEYPGHHVGSITSSRPCLAPEKSLHPGSTYYLEPKQSPLKGAKSLPSNEDFKGFLPDSDRNNGPAPRRARKETRKSERKGDFLTENGQNGFVPRRMSLDTGALFSRQQSADVAALAAAVAASSSMRHSDYVFDATSEDDEEEIISPFQAANRVASRRASVSDASSARSAAASLSEARQLWQDETNMRRHSQPKRVNSLNDLSNYGGYNNGGYDNGGGYDSESNGYNAAVGQQSPAFSQLERQPSCGRSCGGCGAGGSMRSSRSPSPAPSVRSASAAAFPDFEGGDIARGFSALDSADCATGGRSGRRALHRGAGSAQDGSTRPAFPDYDASAAAAACGLVPSPSPPPPGLAQWQQQQSFSRSASYSRNDSREYDSQRDPRPAPRARFPSAPSTPVRRTSLDHRAMRVNLPHPADASAFVASLRGGSPADARSVFTAIDSDSESQCDDGEIADEEGSVKSGGSDLHYVQMQATKPMEDQSKISSKLLPLDTEDSSVLDVLLTNSVIISLALISSLFTLRSSPAQLLPLDTKESSVLDVLVVGCGPAGLSIAAECAKRGLTVGLVGRDAPFVNNYGVWLDEFKAIGLDHCIDQVWTDTILYTDSDVPITTGRAYGRVERSRLHNELVLRCQQAGVRYVEKEVESMDDDARSSSVACTDGSRINSRLVVVAAGAASGKFLKYDNDTRGVGVQTAYGIEVELDSAYPYNPASMLFMDYRDLQRSREELAAEGELSQRPSFLYAMPSTPTRVFFQETCLASRPAMPFDMLKTRLRSRLAQLGVKYTVTHEEEWSYIPVGGSLPLTTQQHLGFGAAASMIHPATGYSITRSLTEAPHYATALAAALRAPSRTSLEAATQAWDHLWSAERKRQQSFMIFGLELILQLDAPATRDFFNAFFKLPPSDLPLALPLSILLHPFSTPHHPLVTPLDPSPPLSASPLTLLRPSLPLINPLHPSPPLRLWRGFLASNLSSLDLLLFAFSTFLVASNPLRFRLINHLITDPSGESSSALMLESQTSPFKPSPPLSTPLRPSPPAPFHPPPPLSTLLHPSPPSGYGVASCRPTSPPSTSSSLPSPPSWSLPTLSASASSTI